MKTPNLILCLLLSNALHAQTQIKFNENTIGTSVISSYKFHNDSFLPIHFAIITRVVDLQLKTLEFQAHHWIKNVSILLSRVQDYKLGKMEYLSLWIRKPLKKTRHFIIP